MRKFTTIDDIEREAEARSRKKFVGDVSEDIKGIFEGVFTPPKKEVKKVKRKWSILKWLGILLLLLFIINFILGNIFLLKFLLKDLFFGG